MLLEALLGKVSKISTAKDDVRVEITIDHANVPDDIFTWQSRFVITKDQEPPKLPIEEEADRRTREEKEREHKEGMNPPPVSDDFSRCVTCPKSIKDESGTHMDCQVDECTDMEEGSEYRKEIGREE